MTIEHATENDDGPHFIAGKYVGPRERVEIPGDHFKGENATACPTPVVAPSPLDVQVGGGHYKKFAIQPVEFCQRNRLGFCESSAIKYICRHGDKGKRQDVEKAIHFLELLLELEYGGRGHDST